VLDDSDITVPRFAILPRAASHCSARFGFVIWGILALCGCQPHAGAASYPALKGTLYATPVLAFAAYVEPASEGAMHDEVEAFAVSNGFKLQFSRVSSSMDMYVADKLVFVSLNPVVSRPGRPAYDLVFSRVVGGSTSDAEFDRLASDLRGRVCDLGGVKCVQGFSDAEYVLPQSPNEITY
jgi:hypothetical protein